MTNRDDLLHAIDVLEAQRAILGDVVTDVALFALREKLTGVEAKTAVSPPTRTTQRKYLTILFANVTGFSGVAESIPETNMLNIVNLLWRRLDGAITAQGGVVDKHIGDAVMGLFGVPIAAEDDPERAIRAALAMRAALSDFIEEVREQWDTAVHSLPSPPDLDNLRLRIGINTGPVLLGEVGTSEEYTVIGDPVNVASRLERAAPSGGILISHETYQLVRGQFSCEALGPMPIKGKQEPIAVYLVLGATPHRLESRGRGIEGVETRMVGRDAELRQLQMTLRQVAQKQTGHVITIAGEAGVGKSRLVHEFTRWVQNLPADILVLKGRTEQSLMRLPYSLLRDLFVATFGLQDTDPAATVEEKLLAALGDWLTDENAAEWPRRIRSLAQLLGLNLDTDYPLAWGLTETPQMRDRAFSDVASLLQAVMARHKATLMVLEDVHWADEGSLDLVDHLVQMGTSLPLMTLCVARPSLFERRGQWGGGTENRGGTAVPSSPATDAARHVEAPQTIIPLSALTRDESQQLVENILRNLPEIPADLSDLIVGRAEGNPYYVEELVKVLIEDGVIIPGDDEWRVQVKHLTNVRVPPTLTGVLQARLDRLSSLERITLQRAAVIGRVFWDTAVVLMNSIADNNPILEPETLVALQALEKRDMVFRRDASVFAGSNAYVFKHEMLREVTYESVLLRTRPIYHKQVADWLAGQSGERVAEYASLIADHYELAEEKISAAEMHEIAALRAQEMASPALALHHYNRVLILLADNASHAAWQLSIQERVAALLRLQARLVDAAVTYRAMRQTAENDGDLAAQARALNGLSDVMYEQTHYATLLENATRAEKVAWLVSEEAQLAQALRYKSQAYQRLGDTALALASARQALEFSERLDDAPAIVSSLQLLGSMYIDWGRYTHAQHFLARLQEQITQWRSEGVSPEAVGLACRALGELYTRLGQYDEAGRSLVLALRLFKQVEWQHDVGRVLYRLGTTARLRGNVAASTPLYREALAVASASGDRYGEMFYRIGLGAALTGAGFHKAAEKQLRRLIEYAEDREQIGDWRGLAPAYLFLAEALLGQGKTAVALPAIHKTLELAQHMADEKLQGLAWQLLGRTAVQLPPDKLPVVFRERPYGPADCFQESLRLLRRAGGNSPSTLREQVLTLRAWADFEATRGNTQRSHMMQQEATALAAEVGMVMGDG